MPESKNLDWLGNYPEQAEEPAEAITPDAPAANDADGWQQYRHWISKAPAPSSRRVGIDPSLYSWRSYRSWTEDVKRNWPDEEDD